MRAVRRWDGSSGRGGEDEPVSLKEKNTVCNDKI